MKMTKKKTNRKKIDFISRASNQEKALQLKSQMEFYRHTYKNPFELIRVFGENHCIYFFA